MDRDAVDHDLVAERVPDELSTGEQVQARGRSPGQSPPLVTRPAIATRKFSLERGANDGPTRLPSGQMLHFALVAVEPGGRHGMAQLVQRQREQEQAQPAGRLR